MKGGHNKCELGRSNKLMLLDHLSSLHFAYVNGFSKISMATSHYYLNHKLYPQTLINVLIRYSH